MSGVPDMLTMNDEQCAVLNRMAGDFGYPMADIAVDTGLTRAKCKSIIRQFDVIGMTGYGPWYNEDSGRVVGSGYYLSVLGRNLQREMRLLIGWRRLEACTTALRAQASS